MDRIKEIVLEQAKDWSERFIRQRRFDLQKKKIKASGQLIKSFESEIIRQTSDATAQLLIAFEDYGRIAEMKNVTHDRWGRDAISRLEAWVRSRGVSNFVEGFRKLQGYVPRTEQKLVNSIAWGIAVKRSGGFRRRRQWYAKPKSAALSQLYNNIAAALPETVADVIKKQMEDGR
jgi:hypothetical protein